jgi:hypothetical protein
VSDDLYIHQRDLIENAAAGMIQRHARALSLVAICFLANNAYFFCSLTKGGHLARKRFEIEREQRIAGATVLQKQFRGRKVAGGFLLNFFMDNS